MAKGIYLLGGQSILFSSETLDKKENVMDSGYFVGYEFKKHLLEVQQAVMVYCLMEA